MFTSLYGCSTPNSLPILRRGSQGEAVKSLQIFLYHAGHYFGQLDGYFNLQTQRSLQAFQSQIGIPSDGIVDHRTWRAITRLQKILDY